MQQTLGVTGGLPQRGDSFRFGAIDDAVIYLLPEVLRDYVDTVSMLGEIDPLDLLRDRMSNVKYAHVEGLPKFHGGAVGYLAYNTIRYFEPSVPPISDEKSGLDVPESVFMLTDSILIFDHVRHRIFMHIVSHVTGDLSDKYDMFDAMKAAFPAGTVSGAPKVRAMQLIAELELDKRGPYSGAVGYFSFTGNMDTAISLRTMVMKDGIAYLQAGGGIVADSDTQTEYEETLHKMGALMRAIDHAEESAGA